MNYIEATTDEPISTPDVVEDDHGKSQAKAQYESIVDMVERLRHCSECDATEIEDCEFADRFTGDADEFEDYHDEDSARDTILDDALEVSVRSGWYSPGGNGIDAAPAEDFLILLCTGGPACRIRGELTNGQPDRAWLEYQDWGTPWTQYFGADQDMLLAYANCFYFGD